MTQSGLVGWEMVCCKASGKVFLAKKEIEEETAPFCLVFALSAVSLWELLQSSSGDEEKQSAGKANHREWRSGERMDLGSVVTLPSH